MGKTKRRHQRPDDEVNEERRLRLLEQKKRWGRFKTPPPTKFFDVKDPDGDKLTTREYLEIAEQDDNDQTNSG